MTPRLPTRPGGIEIDPGSPMLDLPPNRPQQPSRAMLIVLAMVLGILVSTTSLVAFAGRYFWVDRAEYSRDTVDLQKTLVTINLTLQSQAKSMEKQEKNFAALAEAVNALQYHPQRRRR